MTELNDVNGLANLNDQYDLFILDRDGTLQEYHGSQRVTEFENVLKYIAPASELVSNSSFREFLKIGRIYSNLFPVSKLVRFSGGGESPYLLRIRKQELNILRYEQETHSLTDETSRFKGEDNALLDEIVYNDKKPNPLIIHAVIDANIQDERIPENPKTLMVGDRYLTDIVAGNLAGVDTAMVRPYLPLFDTLSLILTRYLLDLPIGFVMSRMAGKK